MLHHSPARYRLGSPSVVSDLEKGHGGSRWRKATAERNTSILVHGVQPIGADGFVEMKELATEFLGFDLSLEVNPIPPLNSR